jgi:hypothetical protein
MSNLGTCSKCVHVDAQPCGVDLFRDTLTITDGKIVGCCDHYRPVAPTPEPVTKRHELDERVERDHPLVEDAEKFLHNVVGMYHEQVPLAFPAALQHIRDLLDVVGQERKEAIKSANDLRHELNVLSDAAREFYAMRDERDSARLSRDAALKDIDAQHKEIEGLLAELDEARLGKDNAVLLLRDALEKDRGKVVLNGWISRGLCMVDCKSRGMGGCDSIDVQFRRDTDYPIPVTLTLDKEGEK